MNVSLPPQLDSYVRSLVRGGDYGSASEVVREGLRLLKEKQRDEEKRAELRGLIQDSLESGPPVSMTSEDLRAMIHDHAKTLRGEVERGERPAPGGPDALEV